MATLLPQHKFTSQPQVKLFEDSLKAVGVFQINWREETPRLPVSSSPLQHPADRQTAGGRAGGRPGGGGGLGSSIGAGRAGNGVFISIY